MLGLCVVDGSRNKVFKVSEHQSGKVSESRDERPFVFTILIEKHRAGAIPLVGFSKKGNGVRPTLYILHIYSKSVPTKITSMGRGQPH